jgi:hypothetical protein
LWGWVNTTDPPSDEELIAALEEALRRRTTEGEGA